MKSNLKTVIEAVEYWEELVAEYKGAREEGKDPAVLEKIRSLMEENAEYINSWDDNWSFMYRLVKHQKEVGNEDIDFNDLHDERTVEKIFNILNMFGIERFTFSSIWSSAVNVAWKFSELGCKLVGMTKVHGNYKDFEAEEYELIPAYVFEIN